MVFNDPGTNDIYFKEFDETITIQKPIILAKNIIYGGLYVDLDGKIVALNHKTGEKLVLNFHQK